MLGVNPIYQTYRLCLLVRSSVRLLTGLTVIMLGVNPIYKTNIFFLADCLAHYGADCQNAGVNPIYLAYRLCSLVRSSVWLLTGLTVRMLF